MLIEEDSRKFNRPKSINGRENQKVSGNLSEKQELSILLSNRDEVRINLYL